MLSFHEALFPVNISYGSSGGPKFKTTVFTSDAGYEQRNVDWAYPKAEYDVSHAIKTQEQMDELTAFFFARHGRAFGFRYKDWNDYKLENASMIGTGETTVQITKTYVSTQTESGETYTFVRSIYKPAWGTIIGVTVDGVAQVEATDFTINSTNGIMTFAVAPAQDAVITIASGEFHVPVRFDTDHLDSSHEGWMTQTWQSIPLIEDRNVFAIANGVTIDAPVSPPIPVPPPPPPPGGPPPPPPPPPPGGPPPPPPGGPPPPPPPPGPPPPPIGGSFSATSAYDFVSRMGVNSHLDRAGHYMNLTAVRDCMNYIGLRLMRDIVGHDPGSPYFDSFMTMAGMGFVFIAESGGPQNWTTYANRCAIVESAHPGSIVACEGPNEITDYGNGFGYMQGLHAAVRANSTLASKPIINLSISAITQSFYQQVGDVSAFCDYGNSHIYYGSGVPSFAYAIGSPYLWTNWLTSARISVPGKPVCVTETGSPAWPTAGGGCDEYTQAREILNMYFVAWKNGAPFTCMYELIDSIDDPNTIEHYFGMFRSDYSAKPVATAMHNMVLAMSSGAVPGVSGTLTYSVSGLPATIGSHLVFRKSANTYTIVVWVEYDVFDEGSHTHITAPNVNITINLGSPATATRTFDPLIGSAAIATTGATSTINIVANDHPVIIDIDV